MINVVRTKRIIRQTHSINNNNNNNNNMKYMLTKILGNNNNNTYNNHNHGINNQNNSFHTTTSMFYAYQNKKGKAERAINRGKSKFKLRNKNKGKEDSNNDSKSVFFNKNDEAVAEEAALMTKNIVVDDGILAGSGIKILERNQFLPPKQDDMEVLDKPIYKLYMLYNALEEDLGWEQDLQNELEERQMHINRHKRMHAWFENNINNKLTNHIMQDGKKVKAEKLVYETIVQLKFEHDKDYESVLSEAIFNTTPEMEVRYMRLGAQRHPVPFPLNSKRKLSLALKWLVAAARSGNLNGFSNNFTNELLLASQNKGSAVKRCEDMHKLAFQGQPYAHFRW